jgi:4-hydroxybenzoate polyprenyltransferase
MFSYIKLLRIRHWIKNLFLFAAPFFGGTLFRQETLYIAVPAFLAFSFIASASYIFNDIKDSERDKLHPKKRKRPIASGSIGKNKAMVFAAILALLSLILSIRITPAFLNLVLLYLFIQLGYSLFLKHVVIADIFCIASGFVIRVLAGSAAFHVDASKWLLLTMFMISLVLGTGKRLGEASLMNDAVEAHRKSLNVYSISTLSEILVISSSAALLSYALYTVEQSQQLLYTIPVVTFGLFRYLLLAKQGMSDPTEALTHDRWLAFTVVLWVSLVGLIRYH